MFGKSGITGGRVVVVVDVVDSIIKAGEAVVVGASGREPVRALGDGTAEMGLGSTGSSAVRPPGPGFDVGKGDTDNAFSVVDETAEALVVVLVPGTNRAVVVALVTVVVVVLAAVVVVLVVRVVWAVVVVDVAAVVTAWATVTGEIAGVAWVVAGGLPADEGVAVGSAAAGEVGDVGDDAPAAELALAPEARVGRGNWPEAVVVGSTWERRPAVADTATLVKAKVANAMVATDAAKRGTDLIVGA